MFEFTLLDPLPHQKADYAGIADAGPLEFDYRLFSARIRLKYNAVTYGQRWQREPLLGFAAAIFAITDRLTKDKSCSFELPEGNDELYFQRNGDSIVFHCAAETAPVLIPYAHLREAAKQFSHSAMHAVLQHFPELWRNKSVITWYPDKQAFKR